jgi:hypothetical protein
MLTLLCPHVVSQSYLCGQERQVAMTAETDLSLWGIHSSYGLGQQVAAPPSAVLRENILKVYVAHMEWNV